MILYLLQNSFEIAQPKVISTAAMMDVEHFYKHHPISLHINKSITNNRSSMVGSTFEIPEEWVSHAVAVLKKAIFILLVHGDRFETVKISAF